MDLMLALVFLCTIMFFLAALVLSFRRGNEVQDRLKVYAGETKDDGEKRHINILEILTRFSRVFASQSYAETIQVELLQAGIPLRGEEYLTIWAGLVAVLPVLSWIITFNWGLTILVACLGAIGPKLYLKSKVDNRRQALNQQLGDALVIMANALRAGFSFQQAMDTVRRELPPPISAEFEWTLREMNLGVGTEEAMENMVRRVGSDDLEMMVSAVLIQRQVGGNLAQILDNISRTIRERARIKREIKTLTAQGRTSGLIIGLLPVALLFLLLIVNPTYMGTLLHSSIGYLMLGIAFTSELIGVLVIKKMVEIEY
ncbi:MAG: type II secretion system F family protein [Chitinophagales bacterium]